MGMKSLCIFALSVFVVSAFAADKPAAAVISTFYKKPHDVTTSIRTNGCKLELRRYPDTYTKSKPNLQGFWVQDLFVDEQLILKIRHSTADKERSLVIEHDSDYDVIQYDRDLDGKYETLVVVSLKDQGLKDVLFVTADGFLRHSTPEEFEAWQRRGQKNRHAIEEADKAIKKAMEKSNEELKK